MKLFELHTRVSRFTNSFLIRKAIFLVASVAVIVCAILGGFYFQLMLNNGMAALIAWAAILIVGILTVISRVLSRKDNYKLFLMYAYASSAETKDIKNTKEFISRVEETIKESVNGYSGFQQCLADNKALLKCMTTGMTAFEEYSSGGLKTALAKLLAGKIFWSFPYFAILDLILSGQTNNHNYRILSSTRWFQVRQKYTKGIISIIAPSVGALIGWIIIANVLVSIISGALDLASSLESLLWFGSLGLILQCLWLRNEKNCMGLMALDLVTPGAVPPADYDLCLAFADISSGYYNACIEGGFIQSTQAQNEIQVDALPIEQDETQYLE